MIRLPLIPALVALMLWAPLSFAQVAEVPYAQLHRELDGRITFDTLPQKPEPGFNLDAPLRSTGAWLAERFAGQQPGVVPPFDMPKGVPNSPLTLMPGAPGRNLSLAFHKGFESNALFALGPDGFPTLSARGEGATAILFDRDQAAFGLRVHSDYPDPLGTRDLRGSVTLRLYNRHGDLIAQTTHDLRPGIFELGLRRTGGIPDIAGVLIINSDPGGIAIDDILFQLTAMTS